MLAAAATLWGMFSLWLVAPYLDISSGVARTAGGLAVAELVSLLAWSYGVEGCQDDGCAPLAHAVGVAARTDIPILAGVFLIVIAVGVRRSRHRARG